MTNATEHHATLAGISRDVAKCRRALEQLADTCCMAQRSAHMLTLYGAVEALDLVAGSGDQQGWDNTAAEQTIEQVASVGGALGRLYATCCTPTREKLYLIMFSALGDIHTGVWKLKGVSH